MEYYGLRPADILLPKKDFEKFAVIACDQYTSEPEYWEKVREVKGDSPSAYDMILPEIYLNDNRDGRIRAINETMQNYLDSGVLEMHENAMIYIERTLCEGQLRRGIIGMIDLDDYDYSKNSKSLIRATEATVTERIPPRVQIRKDAVLEMPHIMLLVDDPNHTVIEPLSEQKDDFEKAYDFDLMLSAGHAAGYFLSDTAKAQISKALAKLTENMEDKLLFAVGDGNHSLATAKECYRLNRTEKSRYALVEVVNIHDESIQFEPIYRVLFNADAADVLAYLKENAPFEPGDEVQEFDCIYDGKQEKLTLKALAKLPVGTLQKLLDKYLEQHKDVTVDYIHGIESTKELCKRPNTLGFIFEGMKKSELFDAIRQDGSLPRKTFSMGHADDKRFYIESRLIR